VSQAPASPSLPRQFLAVFRIILGVGLGLFVIGHTFFLVAYNVVDMSGEALKNLKKQKRIWERSQKPGEELARDENPTIWPRVTGIKHLGPILEEWVEKDKKSPLTKAKLWVEPRLDFYARLTGQEQGWSLFAPDVVDWSSLISLEMRWDDDPEAILDRPNGKALVALGGGPALLALDDIPEGAPRSMLLLSDNHPRDINAYFRFGLFRLRKFESKMETALRKHGDDEATYLNRWQIRAREKVRGDDSSNGAADEIMIYFRWKLRKFQQEHPELPEPKQIILRSHTWTIPPPPGPTPWSWVDESDEPICRWRPGRHLPAPENLELYLHTEHRFESKNPTR
jgi:hypothetical protein